MLALRLGKPEDAADLSALILSSAPILLPYLFGDEQQTLDFIYEAAQISDGQYSAAQHYVVYEKQHPIACMTLWKNNMSASFQHHTVKSVKQFLSSKTLLHLVKANVQIQEVFLAPQSDEMCIGHLAVTESYRRKGVGKLLIEHAISKAKQLSKTSIVLDVDAQNEQALSFYEGLGFVLVHSKTYTGTGQIFHRLAYRLT